MADNFSSYQPSLTAPASKLAVITPNDGADLPTTTRGIYVGTGGDLAVIGADDTVAVTIPAVPSGSIVPVRAKRVLATGTTALGLVGLS